MIIINYWFVIKWTKRKISIAVILPGYYGDYMLERRLHLHQMQLAVFHKSNWSEYL